MIQASLISSEVMDGVQADITHLNTSHLPRLSRPLPWTYAVDYSNYTEEVADRAMEQHIEENVCSLLTPQCSATTTPVTTPMPSFLSNSQCMPGTGSCYGGRRLETGDRGIKEAASPQRVDVNPNTTCVQFDPSLQAPKSTVTIDPSMAPLVTTTMMSADAAHFDGPGPVFLALAFLLFVRR